MLAAALWIGATLVDATLVGSPPPPAATEARTSDAGTPDAVAPPAPPEAVVQAAKDEVTQARAAAAQGDYPLAVEHFQAAFAIHPLPQLQYNIAVCYHRLTIEAVPDSAAYAQHKDAAIAAYNRYLALAPDAADRADVEANVVALGGKLATQTDASWTPALVHPQDVPDPPEFADPLAGIVVAQPDADPDLDLGSDPDPDPDADTVALARFVGPPDPPQDPVAAAVNPARVALGVFVPLVLASPRDLARSDEFSAAPMIGLGLRAGGFLGNRRRINLGGELSLVGQPLASKRRHVLASGWLGLALGYEHPVRDRLRIGGGGLVAITGQNLHYKGSDPLRCGVRTSGAVSQRTGVLLAGRFILAAMLGKRRRHALTLSVTPGLAVHGSASSSQDEGDVSLDLAPCRDLPDPFATFGLNAGPSFVLVTDFGYAFRL